MICGSDLIKDQYRDFACPNLCELEGVVFVSWAIEIGVTTAHIATNLYKSSRNLDVIELPQSFDTASGEEESLLTLSVCDKQIYKL